MEFQAIDRDCFEHNSKLIPWEVNPGAVRFGTGRNKVPDDGVTTQGHSTR